MYFNGSIVEININYSLHLPYFHSLFHLTYASFLLFVFQPKWDPLKKNKWYFSRLVHPPPHSGLLPGTQALKTSLQTSILSPSSTANQAGQESNWQGGQGVKDIQVKVWQESHRLGGQEVKDIQVKVWQESNWQGGQGVTNIHAGKAGQESNWQGGQGVKDIQVKAGQESNWQGGRSQGYPGKGWTGV